jgi:hypothetical protein
LDWHTHALRLGVNLSSPSFTYLIASFNEYPNLFFNKSSEDNCNSLSNELNFNIPLGNPNGYELSEEFSSDFPLEHSELPEDMMFDVSISISDASNVGLQDSQNLMHNSKAETVLSGEGFVTKNSENFNFKNLKNFIKNSQVILNYQRYDEMSFFNLLIPLVLLLVAISSHELHFSYYFLLQQYKYSCSS